MIGLLRAVGPCLSSARISHLSFAQVLAPPAVPYTSSLQGLEVGEKRERTVGEESGRMVQRKASWLHLKPGLRD